MTWLPISREAAESLYMDESAEEQIVELEQYLQGHCNKIRDLLSDREAHTHAEILAFSVLDSLGYIVNPKKSNGGGVRIRSFIEKFCARDELKLYSVPAMLSALRLSDDRSVQDLRDRCEDLFNQHWQPDSFPSIEHDLKDSEVVELFPGKANAKIDIGGGAFIELDQCKHSRMLSGKRNAITHQLVKRGFRQGTRTSMPYYIWSYNSNLSSLPADWNLVYSLSFLLELCDKGIAATCAYLRSKNTKPYPRLIPATAWLAH